MNPSNGNIYYLLNQDSWTNSEAEALALGGSLVTINDAAENAFVFNTFAGGGTRNLWIGLDDPTQDSGGGSHVSNFVWADGETASYRNWSLGEPTNAGPNGVPEYYTMMWGNSADISQFPSVRVAGTWNDIINSGIYPPTVPNSVSGAFGVVEITAVPLPEALWTGMPMLAAIAFFRLRKRHPVLTPGVVP